MGFRRLINSLVQRRARKTSFAYSLFALVLQHLYPILERHRAEVFAVPLPAAAAAVDGCAAAARVPVGPPLGVVGHVEEALHVVARRLGVGGQAWKEGGKGENEAPFRGRYILRTKKASDAGKKWSVRSQERCYNPHLSKFKARSLDSFLIIGSEHPMRFLPRLIA